MTAPDFLADRVFLHLSDIHFRKGRTGDVHDTDADLRNELERDLRNIRTTRVQRIDGVIVSGDIAYGGLREEFEFAKGWLERVRELIDCPKEGIMVTPGNHDVDRSGIATDGVIDRMHMGIRAVSGVAQLDAAIASILRDATQSEYLFTPMKAYNEFASQYGCQVSPNKPYWERDFSLGNGGILRIRGMTSTLISGPRDHAQTFRLLYGGAQRSLIREQDVYRVVVGHHPPSWTLEGDDADRAFSERAVMQLFGHKHENWFSPAGRGVRVIAGAVHPERTESNWEPRYSLLAVRLADDGRLHIRVYPRKWTREETIFMGDFNSKGEDYRDHVVTPLT